ncbi:MAG: HAMP domain-containing sensor histidine kinase [Pedobacter sp.]|nr:HAMP domain-containing sensor histidine kinase [Pedobacter sp.]MDQ8053737.1 HAMP domain-containing sensor histidine kinase [Pedobacter sp.]
MKKLALHTNLLISCCALTVIFLCYIQYYLIRNTYNLTKANYHKEVQGAIKKIIADPKISSSNDSALVAFKVSFYDLAIKVGKVDSNTVIRKFIEENAIRNKENLNLLNEQLKKNPLLKDLKYEFKYDSLIVETTGKVDSVFFKTKRSITVLGTPIVNKNATNIERYLITSRDYDNYHEGKTKQEITFKIWLSRNVDISNEKAKIFKRMLGVFLLALILILVITTLFFLIIYNLIRQKKIAEIKTDLANNITHELKTPLASLNIIIKSLHKKEVLSNEALFNNVLDSLHRQNIRLQQLIDNVMESSIYHEPDLPEKKFNIIDFIAHYFEDFKIDTHQLDVALENKPTMIYGDKIKLTSVLNNLLENAIKYSPVGSTLKIRSFILQRYFCISIEDQGIGIAKSEQQEIFQKFYRVAEDRNIHTTKGLGLGLYICEQHMKYLNGTIQVKSELGKGSIFTIKIPIYGA